MKMNFKTRSEARKYCWSRQIPLKSISKRDTGGLPWVVETEEIQFQAGRKYKLVDVTGFITNSYGSVNTANKIQAHQIEKYAPDGIVIDLVEFGYAYIEPVPFMSFTKLNCDESKYFIEVTENHVVQKNPDEWVAGQYYKLVDVEGFSNRIAANKTIVFNLNLKNKPLYIHHVSSVGIGSLTGKDNNKLDAVDGTFFQEERKYFVETEAPEESVKSPQIATVAESTLDSELDNGTNLKPEEVAEKNPGIWVVGQHYKLVDVVGFINSDCHNSDIVDELKLREKPFMVDSVDYDGDCNAESDSDSNFFYKKERKFFQEVQEPQSPAIVAVNVDEQTFEKKTRELQEKLLQAHKNYGEVMDSVQDAYAQTIAASDELAKHLQSK